jgi:hypothetical protein
MIQSLSFWPARWDCRTQRAFVPAGALMTMVSEAGDIEGFAHINTKSLSAQFGDICSISFGA